MKTRPEIEVFDDLERCGSVPKSCAFLFTFAPYCHLYNLKLDQDNGFVEGILKCDQCKADYAEAKQEQPVSCIVIDGHLYDCISSRLKQTDGGKIKVTILINHDSERLEFVRRFKQPCEMAISTHDGFFNYIGILYTIDMRVSTDGSMRVGTIIQVIKTQEGDG